MATIEFVARRLQVLACGSCGALELDLILVLSRASHALSSGCRPLAVLGLHSFHSGHPSHNECTVIMKLSLDGLPLTGSK